MQWGGVVSDDVKKGDRPYDGIRIARVLRDVANERASQHAQWGDQSWRPYGDAYTAQWGADIEARARMINDKLEQWTWASILAEEVGEAMTEDDPAQLRAELVQVAAVAVAWIEAIDMREGENE